jgi:two-component system chemotaxis sensor kinase CheA
MDDLLREFLTETTESLDTVDVELVRFEQDPTDAKILGNIFRLVHTIKGTCGFLALPRLEALAHAAETLMGKFRDGMPVTGEAVDLILASIDRIKVILGELEASQQEPAGADSDLISALERMVLPGGAAAEPAKAEAVAEGELVYQVLERPLRPGEVSLDDLERAFRTTEVEEPSEVAKPDAPAKKAGQEEEERPESKVANQSLRVNVETLEYLMTRVSELVLTRNQLLEIVRRHADSEFKVPLQRLSNVTAELQEGVMKTRMQPIGNAWQKLPRVVRDLAGELGKDIDLQMFGADTELDRQVLELIKDPLTHMVRNSADHGLETPAERVALGKPEKGSIRLSAYHEGGHIIIEIADDGRGLNTGKIRKKAVASGLVDEADAEKLTDAQVHKFIFAAGLSTAQAVTSVSGRGVGMDVVKTNVDQIGGTIEVKSVEGAGSAFVVKIPLTLAIVPALIVEADQERFAIPQRAVVELVGVRMNSEHRIERIKNTPVLRLRDKLLPLVHLGSVLGIHEGGAGIGDEGFIVVTQVGAQKFGIVVDGVFHTEEIVVKPMSTRLRHIGMFSGNTILGDGSVIMIVDPNGLSSAVGNLASDTRPTVEAEADHRDNSEAATSLLVFRAGSQSPRAVPLALVTRLEEIDAKRIEVADGLHLVQYRDKLMPILPVDATTPIRREGGQPILVFADEGRYMGIAVDAIVDIVEDRLSIELASRSEGILGSAIVKGQVTEIVDVGHFLSRAFADCFHDRPRSQVAARANLLLVDDSPFFRNLLPSVLHAAGYRVTTVASAEAALQTIAGGERFDVILSDLEMPGMGGLEFARAVRGDKRMGRVPLIALSSHAASSTLDSVRAAGFDDFVAKFDRPGLVAALKNVTVELAEAA